jgi:hypothetical protein
MKKTLLVVLCTIMVSCFSFRARAVNHAPSFTGGHKQTLSACKNSTTLINTTLSVLDIDAGQTETWSLLLPATHGAVVASYSVTSTGGTLVPVGLSYTPTTGYTGNDTFKVRITDGFASDTTMVVVTVNPLPDAGSITGASNVCVGASIPLTDGTPGGTWSAWNTNASVSGGVVTGIAGGVDTIIYSVVTSCGTAAAVKIITVDPLPDPGTIVGASAVCIGSSISLSDAMAGGGWAVSNGHATILTGVVTGVSAGVATVSYSVTGACGTATATMTITVAPVPSAGIISPSGATSICVGDTVVLSDATTGGVWGRTNSNASVNTLGTVKGLKGGVDTILYTVNNACGSDVAMKTVTVNALPVAKVIKGAASVCVGGTTTLSDETPGGVWSSSKTSVAKITSGGVVTGSSFGTATISYTVTNGCGTAMATMSFSVDLPALPILDSANTVCPGGTLTLLDLSPGGTWSSSSPFVVFAVGIPGVGAGIAIGITPGTATVTYTVTNGCGTTKATVDITVLTPEECNPPLISKPVTPVAQGLEISPNPSNGMFTMNLATNDQENAEIIITNVLGEKVMSFGAGTNHAQEVHLDVPAGVYMVTAITNGARYTTKVMITK